MATILFTWELGLGLGHLATIRPLVAGLAERGHRVVVAVRDLTHAGRVLSGIDAEILPAPIRLNPIAGRIDPPSTFAQVLHNIGFGQADDLWLASSVWQTLYRYVQPNLIVAEHSPTALLAARRLSIPVAALGTGFSCPAAVETFPDWRPELNNDPAALLQSEAHVLENVNRLLVEWGTPPLGRLSDLYSQADETLLVTYPELDPFGERVDTPYLGNWPEIAGQPPVWPAGELPKVFAYLKPFKALPKLLEVLVQTKWPTILRVSGDTGRLRKSFDAPNLCWQDGFIDIDQTVEQCDYAISNATHVMTASMLLAGCPVLMFPPMLEQRLTAEQVVRLGAGQIANPASEATVLPAFKALVSDDRHRQAAEAFAERHRQVDREERLEQAVARLERAIV